MDRAREELEAIGGRLVLIGQADPRQAAHVRRRLGLGSPLLADEARHAGDNAEPGELLDAVRAVAVR